MHCTSSPSKASLEGEIKSAAASTLQTYEAPGIDCIPGSGSTAWMLDPMLELQRSGQRTWVKSSLRLRVKTCSDGLLHR